MDMKFNWWDGNDICKSVATDEGGAAPRWYLRKRTIRWTRSDVRDAPALTHAKRSLSSIICENWGRSSRPNQNNERFLSYNLERSTVTVAQSVNSSTVSSTSQWLFQKTVTMTISNIKNKIIYFKTNIKELLSVKLDNHKFLLIKVPLLICIRFN